MRLSVKQAIILGATIILLAVFLGLSARHVEERYDFGAVKGNAVADLVYFYGREIGRKMASTLPEKPGSRKLVFKEREDGLHRLFPLARRRYYFIAAIILAGFLLFNAAGKK